MKNCIILHEKYTLTINGIHRFSFEMLNVSVYMVLANGQIAHWVVSVFSAVPFLIFLTICRDKLKSNQEHNFYAVCIVICKDILTHCMVHKLGLGLAIFF